MLTRNEKDYLANVLKGELAKFREDKKPLFLGMSMQFLKAEHEYEHFLEDLLNKLKDGKRNGK